MKIFNTKLLALVTSALLLGACSQMATYENEDLTNGLEKADQAGFKLNPYGTGTGFGNAMLLDGGGNYDDCITEESGDEFKAYGDLNANWGGGPNAGSKSLTVEVWNTLTTIEYRFTLTSSNPNGNNLQYFDETILPDGDWVGAGQLEVNVPLVISRDLPSGWGAGDVITEQWRQVGGGSPLDAGDVAYTLIGECTDCDDAAFSYETADNQNITFTFNHGEEVESLTLAFTFPQVLNLPLNENGDYVAPDGKIYSVNNPTNQTVFTWTGAVSCKSNEAETFEFSMTADCSAPPANDGKANIWTDTKITHIDGVELEDTDLNELGNQGYISLKGNLANIVYTGCPVNP